MIEKEKRKKKKEKRKKKQSLRHISSFVEMKRKEEIKQGPRRVSGLVLARGRKKGGDLETRFDTS